MEYIRGGGMRYSQPQHTTSYFSKSILNVAVVFMLVFCSSSPVMADQFNRWNWRNPLPHGSFLNNIKFCNDRFFAVGDKGAILTSLDGIDWQYEKSRTGINLYSIAYGNGMYTVVGGSDSLGYLFPVLLTSKNGNRWVKRLYSDIINLYNVAYGNNMFVAPVFRNRTIISYNGIDWYMVKLKHDAGKLIMLRNIIFADGRFVAEGTTDYDNDMHAIFVSTDGIQWTQTTAGTESHIGVAYGDGKFIVYGMNNAILVSSDAVNWVETTTPVSLFDMVYGNGQFIASGGGSVYASTDASTWTLIASEHVGKLVYGNGTYVAFEYGGEIAVSKDGGGWTRQKPDNNYYSFKGIVYGAGRFVAVGNTSSLTSVDGVTWSSIPVGGSGIIYAGGKFLTSSAASYSQDGLAWAWNPSSPPGMVSVAYGKGKYIGVSYDYRIYESYDGITWKEVQNALGSYPGFYANTIEFINGVFMVGGEAGYIHTSEDGKIWTAIPIKLFESYNGIQSITYGNGLYIAAGYLGRDYNDNGLHVNYYSSIDGKNWTAQKSSSPLYLNKVKFLRGSFIGFNLESSIYISVDGLHWQQKGTLPVEEGFNDVAYGNYSIVLVGSYSSIIQSDQFLTLISPNGGELLKAGESFMINWAGPSTASHYSLHYSVNNGTSWMTIGKSISGNQFDWLVPTLPADRKKCLIRVTAYTAKGKKLGADKSNKPFIIQAVIL